MEFIKLEDYESVLSFMVAVDKTFPIPLSHKTDLAVLASKLCEKGVVFGCKTQNKTVGLIGMYANDFETKTAYISVLAVLNEYSGKGIASHLLQDAVEEAKLCGMRKVRLYTHKTNKGAIHLYKKAGFCENHDENRPDDILFTLELNN